MRTGSPIRLSSVRPDEWADTLIRAALFAPTRVRMCKHAGSVRLGVRHG